MSTEKQLFQRYENTEILVNAVQKTINDPNKSVADNLAEGDKKSRQMSAVLVSGGAAISSTALAAISVETAAIGGIAAVGGGMGLAAGVVGGILGGPLVWGSGIVALLVVWIRKIIKKRQEKKTTQPKKEKKVKVQKAYEEKVTLLKKIIQKQQAIIDALSKENQSNKERIRNLEEALKIMKEAQGSVESDFAVA